MTKKKHLEVSYKLPCCIGYEPMTLLRVIWDWCEFSSDNTAQITNKLLRTIMMEMPTPELSQNLEILMHWELISVAESYDFLNEGVTNTFSIPQIPKLTRDIVIGKLGGMSKKGWITPREYAQRKKAFESLPLRKPRTKKSILNTPVSEWTPTMLIEYAYKRLDNDRPVPVHMLRKVKQVWMKKFEDKQQIKDYIDDTINYLLSKGETVQTIHINALFSIKMIEGYIYRNQEDNGLEGQKNDDLPMFIPVTRVWTMDADEIESILSDNPSETVRDHMQRQIEIEEKILGHESEFRSLL